jgi:hypothetical protein
VPWILPNRPADRCHGSYYTMGWQIGAVDPTIPSGLANRCRGSYPRTGGGAVDPTTQSANVCDIRCIRDGTFRNNDVLHCMTYTLHHGISRPVENFILGPPDIWDILLWDVLSCLCSARGCFAAASIRTMIRNFEIVQLDYFFRWFREEETVMRLARTARGFGDPLAGTFFTVSFFYIYLLLLFFLLAMYARTYLLKTAALWGSLACLGKPHLRLSSKHS